MKLLRKVVLDTANDIMYDLESYKEYLKKDFLQAPEEEKDIMFGDFTEWLDETHTAAEVFGESPEALIDEYLDALENDLLSNPERFEEEFEIRYFPTLTLQLKETK